MFDYEFRKERVTLSAERYEDVGRSIRADSSKHFNSKLSELVTEVQEMKQNFDAQQQTIRQVRDSGKWTREKLHEAATQGATKKQGYNVIIC